MKNYRQEISELIVDWLNEPRSDTEVINFLIYELAADLYWLKQHISTEDREILKESARKL